MSKASRIIVLCEDKAHEVFVRRFLTKVWRVAHRDIKVSYYPEGEGSGKKHVQDRIEDEVKAYRSRHASTILIVMHDADEKTVAQIQQLLDSKIGNARAESDRIAYIIPKWHIETWLAYLEGRDVGETEKMTYKKEYSARAKIKESYSLIDRLAEQCRNKEESQ